MGYNQNYSGGTPAAGGGGNILQPHSEVISGGATWHWALSDDDGVESVTGGSPVDMTGTRLFHPEGPAGEAGSLDADASSAISGGIGAGVRIHTAVTVAAWVRRNDAQGGNTVICGVRQAGSTEALNSPWEMSVETANKIRVVWHTGVHVAQTSVASVALALDTWEHWCFTRPTAATSCKIYKNGVIDGTEFTGLTKGTGSTGIGTISLGQQGSAGTKFEGDIFSAIVYEEELSAANVLALYNSTASDGAW